MPKILESSFVYHLLSSNGVVFNEGGKIYTYEAGTTTPLATYTDSALSTAHANPIIFNSVGQTQNASGDYKPVYLANDSYKFVFTDANDVTLFTVDNYDATTTSSSLTTVMLGGFDFGNDVPAANQVSGPLVCDRALSLPAGVSGSYARAETAATAQTIFTLKKNGSSFGTVTFAAAGTTGTFSVASPVTFAAGDTVTVVAPGTADLTIRYIGVTLRFTIT